MRFLHLADVHLDTPFAGRSADLRERLRAASREAFRAAVDLALDESVHAVLVAGDLFDGGRLSFATERFLLEETARLTEAGVRVVYATGNHDPGRLPGRARSLEWPEGVTVVDTAEPVRIEVTDREGRLVGRVTAAGHETAAERRDLASRFPTPEGGVPEVALLHTQVVGARRSEAHDRYAPSELETLRGAGYDYWALGHVHERQELSAEPPIHYPGNPQGRNPRERGAKGGLLVELEPGGRAAVRFRELGPVRWETLRVDDLPDAQTVGGLEEAIRRRWEEVRAGRGESPGGGGEWILRVVLSGGTPLWRELGREEELGALADGLEATLGVLAVEVRAGRTHPVVDVEEHRDRPDVVGEVLELLDAVRAGREGLEELDAGELAGGPPAGNRAALQAYAAELLENADEELLARLLVDADGGGG